VPPTIIASTLGRVSYRPDHLGPFGESAGVRAGLPCFVPVLVRVLRHYPGGPTSRLRLSTRLGLGLRCYRGSSTPASILSGPAQTSLAFAARALADPAELGPCPWGFDPAVARRASQVATKIHCGSNTTTSTSSRGDSASWIALRTRPQSKPPRPAPSVGMAIDRILRSVPVVNHVAITSAVAARRASVARAFVVILPLLQRAVFTHRTRLGAVIRVGNASAPTDARHCGARLLRFAGEWVPAFERLFLEMKGDPKAYRNGSGAWNTFEMAKDVASFANAIGGTILVGAVQTKRGLVLERTTPLTRVSWRTFRRGFAARSTRVVLRRHFSIRYCCPWETVQCSH
jgi:hypothetical protein